ncbi:hypothetical protein [Actinomadura sp. HBU206391]|uniref:hypothetical protein n=1 Tax=Actinomadura sp. HBU206391 TaxID=2731692 RepID=UPI00164F3C51|nr:hypothetical protein [Actinomadura sp. HBU206391]MBC6462899.1 hypothetical protein [Actinomadura sp. HBU206391]
MVISKSMAAAVSGLALMGGAGLAVGTADSASAQTSVVAPQHGNRGWGGGCCRGRSNHHFRNWQHNHWRNHQRVIVINRNNNYSKSDTDQFQRQRQNQDFEKHEQLQKPMKNADD